MKQYQMTFDFHTHTTFSHGKNSIEDNVKAAVECGLKAIAISDHGPGHLTYGVKREDFGVMRKEIERLKPLYPDLDIFLSVEANIVSTGNHLDVNEEEKTWFDFIIGGYHYGIPKGYCVGNWLDAHHLAPGFVGKSLLVKNTDMTIKALYENDLKFLTHPGDKGRFDIREIAKACADTNTWMEISTWHDHLTTEEIKIAAKEDVKFIISSDAHTANRIGSFEGGLKRAFEAGIDIDRIVNIEEN